MRTRRGVQLLLEGQFLWERCSGESAASTELFMECSPMLRVSSFSVVLTGIDSLFARKSFAAHNALFDVEPRNNEFALVVRSDDKFAIGRTNSPERCEFCFNDETGAAVPFALATSADRAILDGAANELIAFYSAPKSDLYSARIALLGEVSRAVLPLVISVFGAGTYAPSARGL